MMIRVTEERVNIDWLVLLLLWWEEYENKKLVVTHEIMCDKDTFIDFGGVNVKKD